MEKWGFTFLGTFAVWLKTRPMVVDGSRRFTVGVGSYTRNNAELLVLGARTEEGIRLGREIIALREAQTAPLALRNPPDFAMSLPGCVVVADRLAHSQKPDVFRDLICQYTAHLNCNERVELFARQGGDPRFLYEGDQLDHFLTS